MSTLTLAAPPALATLAVAVALLALRAAPPPLAARVYGAPPVAGRLALRAEVVRGVDGREGPAAGLTVTARLAAMQVEATTDADGTALLALDAAPGELWVGVAGVAGTPLAVGTLGTDVDAWAAAEVVGASPLAGRAAGALKVEVALARGAAVVSRPAPLQVRVSRAVDGPASGEADGSNRTADGVAGVTLRADADAATVEPASAVTDAAGLASFTWHTVDPGGGLRLAARLGDETGAWEGVVPAASGCEVEAVEGGWRVRAPVPRERAFFALQHRGGVSLRGVLPLRAAGGSWEGVVPTSEVGSGEPRWLVVGPDAALDGATAVGWPLNAVASFPPEASRRVPDRLLLDGLPAAAGVVARRAAQVRRWALAVTALMAGISLAQLARDRARGVVPGAVVPAADGAWPLPVGVLLVAGGYALLGAALWAVAG